MFPYWFSVWIISIDISRLLKSPIFVLLSISPIMFVNICFMYLGVPMYSYFKRLVGLIPLSLSDALEGMKNSDCLTLPGDTIVLD